MEPKPTYFVDERLAGMVTAVANSRRWLREQQELVARLQERLEATPEFAELSAAIEVMNGIKDDVQKGEHFLKLTAVRDFDGTNTKPHPAVTVKQYKTSEYDPTSALVWSIEYGIDQAIKLDARAFEREAKILMQMSSMNEMKAALQQFYAVKQEPRATLATDLTPYESYESVEELNNE